VALRVHFKNMKAKIKGKKEYVSEGETIENNMR
jgi:hypothetical protein